MKQETLAAVEQAVNGSIRHYFTNLSTKESLTKEVRVLTDLLLEIQGWLFFSEESLENIRIKHMMSGEEGTTRNLVWTLTVMFRTRLVIEDTEYQEFIYHITEAFNVGECSDTEESDMAEQYRSRLPTSDTVIKKLMNNRHLVFLAAMYLFVDAEIIEQILERTSE